MSSKQASLTDSVEEPWKDEDTLYELYHDGDLNQSEIADELDTTPSTISYWMSKFEIETTHSNYQDTVGEQEGRECKNYQECGNETPGPNNGMCVSCLSEAREKQRERQLEEAEKKWYK